MLFVHLVPRILMQLSFILIFFYFIIPQVLLDLILLIQLIFHIWFPLIKHPLLNQQDVSSIPNYRIRDYFQLTSFPQLLLLQNRLLIFWFTQYLSQAYQSVFSINNYLWKIQFIRSTPSYHLPEKVHWFISLSIKSLISLLLFAEQ